MQDALTCVASIFSLDSEKTSYTKSEGCGGCGGCSRRTPCLEFPTWNLPEGAHQRREKALWSTFDESAWRGARQRSDGLLSLTTPKPLACDSARVGVGRGRGTKRPERQRKWSC